uniref:C2H2-type domain-containing protein n=1 Tax=Neogobius melanostomus TaxID=47308 RepID=A0A8C6WJP4_9GOBI
WSVYPNPCKFQQHPYPFPFLHPILCSGEPVPATLSSPIRSDATAPLPRRFFFFSRRAGHYLHSHSPPGSTTGQVSQIATSSLGQLGASRKVLYCQLCPRVFFYLSDLERHAITHSQKKPHVCAQCGKAFKRSSHLQRHKHIHTGQRNFVCPICAKRFREAGELQRHQRVHTGEKPYQCTLCHTRFAERNTLRRHTKRKHPYHQAAMEMLSEKKNGGGGGREASAVHEEESAEWYSSSVSHLDNSESETEA